MNGGGKEPVGLGWHPKLWRVALGVHRLQLYCAWQLPKPRRVAWAESKGKCHGDRCVGM